ncbi:glycosyltransferase family 4 protein [Candidatus Omnitrophota bacterium]
MRIAFFVYPSAFQTPGGGEIFLLKTKETLQKKGVYVKLFNQWEDKLTDFDILHVFGSVKDCLGLMRTAKNIGTKVALSPVFWSTLQRSWNEYGTLPKKLKMVAQHATKAAFPIAPSARREMMALSDILLPNSHAEADQVARYFKISKKKMRVIYLGVDERFAKSNPALFKNRYNIDKFILSVGRFEPRKNQLNLIKALKGFKMPLVFIGSAAAGYEEYLSECKKNADKSTIFIERVDHEDKLLASAYAASELFVLQSWLETPGLVALEAGLAGTRLAVTEAGSTREYFKNYVEYLDPVSTQSIRGAIERELSKEKNDKLKEYILKNFLWSSVADENIKVYKELMGSK